MLPVVKKRTYFPHMADEFFNNRFLSNYFSDGADYMTPKVNIKENENQFEIELAAPGVNKEDFNINIDKDVLQISTEKEEKNEKEKADYKRKEFSYNSFSRSFSIPDSIDVNKIKASHINGILKIELPKKAETKVKKSIKIS